MHINKREDRERHQRGLILLKHDYLFLWTLKRKLICPLTLKIHQNKLHETLILYFTAKTSETGSAARAVSLSFVLKSVTKNRCNSQFSSSTYTLLKQLA